MTVTPAFDLLVYAPSFAPVLTSRGSKVLALLPCIFVIAAILAFYNALLLAALRVGSLWTRLSCRFVCRFGRGLRFLPIFELPLLFTVPVAHLKLDGITFIEIFRLKAEITIVPLKLAIIIFVVHKVLASFVLVTMPKFQIVLHFDIAVDFKAKVIVITRMNPEQLVVIVVLVAVLEIPALRIFSVLTLLHLDSLAFPDSIVVCSEAVIIIFFRHNMFLLFLILIPGGCPCLSRKQQGDQSGSVEKVHCKRLNTTRCDTISLWR
mmetsp:Transcript_46501/g.140896  ORF Transcript_46501/g.140896 Transcript_46501/m.140896 type:complete len:264 (+) Transcript_46501:427-1218(+)